MNLQYNPSPTESSSTALQGSKGDFRRGSFSQLSNERVEPFTPINEADTRVPGADGRQRSSCLQETVSNISSIQSRYDVLETQRKITTLRSIRGCGMSPIWNGDVEVQVRQSGKVGFGGLNSCGCANCLRCASSRSKKHADKITQLIIEAEVRGLECWFLTSNISSHNNSRQLQKFWKDLNSIWTKTFSPRFNKDNNIEGTARSFDWTLSKTTFNLNGHFHSLIFTAPGWDLNELKDVLFSRWSKYTLKQTGIPASFEAQDLQRITSTGVADYLVKAFGDEESPFNTLEVSAANKSGNGLWGWTLQGLIEEIARTGSKRCIAAYRSIERELKHKTRVSYQGICRIMLESAAPLIKVEEKDPIVEVQVVPKPVWWSFRSHRVKILIAFAMNGIAKTYFTLLCERLALGGEIMSREDIDDHLNVFLKAFERDKSDKEKEKEIDVFEDLDEMLIDNDTRTMRLLLPGEVVVLKK